MTFFAIASCVKEETKNAPIESELNDEAVLKSLRSSSKKKRKLEAVPYVMEATCGVTETFELWYGQDFPYGTVTVYNNNEFLYIQYDVDKNLIDAGWGFHTTYLFVGDYSKLPYKEVETDEGKIITVIDWDDNIINRETYDDNPTSVVRSIALIELPECFGIASKAKLNNPFGGQNEESLLIKLLISRDK